MQPDLVTPATPSPYARVGARLVDMGYSAVPVMPGTKVPGAVSDGEWHRQSDWNRFGDRLPTHYELPVWGGWRNAGVCVVLNHAVKVVDVDTADPDILAVVREILPVSPVVKRGRKGYSAFYRGAPEIGPRKFRQGKQPVVEILAYGNQTVIPPTIHPDTGRPYAWDGEPLEAYAPEDLPELTAETISDLADALAAFGIEKESESPLRQERAPESGNAWRDANDAALADIGAWVPALGIPGTENTGKSYRLPAIWRGGDGGNVSVHPNGIRDFVTGRGMTPIDLVMESLRMTESQALRWIQDRLGIVPPPTEVRFNFKAKLTASNDNRRSSDVTEDSAALRFAELYDGHLRYCHDTGAWFGWTGAVWERNNSGIAFHLARELARELSSGLRDKELAAVQKTSFASGIERFAKADPTFAVGIDHWDADPFKLGTPRGTVDLRTGSLSPASPTDGITKLTAVAPSDNADCPRWLRFLEESTGGDKEMIRFLQQWAGYSLTGDTREHALVFVYGGGGNGKSVFLNAVAGIMKDYATTAAMETFTASQADKHPTDLAMLRGARLVTASETEEGKAWAEAKIKQMTGGDPITARFMRQDFFTFRPNFKLTIIGNHKPALRNVDDAARRRFRIVPFTRKPAKPDKELEARLKSEWPGILRWMIAGCLDWQENGLVRPESVSAATDAYFSEQDFFAQWLEDCCIVEQDNASRMTSSADLFLSWSGYAERGGERAGSQKSFAEQMRRKGFESYRTKASRGFRGIEISRSHPA